MQFNCLAYAIYRRFEALKRDMLSKYECVCDFISSPFSKNLVFLFYYNRMIIRACLYVPVFRLTQKQLLKNKTNPLLQLFSFTCTPARTFRGTSGTFRASPSAWLAGAGSWCGSDRCRGAGRSRNRERCRCRSAPTAGMHRKRPALGRPSSRPRSPSPEA